MKFLFPCNHGFIYIDTNSTSTISNIYAYKNSLFKVFLRYFFSNYFNQNTDQNIRYKLTADSKFPESINMVACAHKVNFSIKENPKASSFVYKNVRSYRMQIFPYNVIYRISNLNIQVIAVFHHSRNPREWKKRS